MSDEQGSIHKLTYYGGPSLLFRLHMWFIRLIARHVELVQNQIEINEFMEQIKSNAQMMAVPIVKVKKKK